MIWESGRESGYIDDIAAGRKLYEGRLKRGKFAEYRPGDFVWLRRDTMVNGLLTDGEPHQLLVKVEDVREFPNFKDMLRAVGYDLVIPRAQDFGEALDLYNHLYTPEDQNAHGVVAIKIRPADPKELP